MSINFLESGYENIGPTLRPEDIARMSGLETGAILDAYAETEYFSPKTVIRNSFTDEPVAYELMGRYVVKYPSSDPDLAIEDTWLLTNDPSGRVSGLVDTLVSWPPESDSWGAVQLARTTLGDLPDGGVLGSFPTLDEALAALSAATEEDLLANMGITRSKVFESGMAQMEAAGKLFAIGSSMIYEARRMGVPETIIQARIEQWRKENAISTKFIDPREFGNVEHGVGWRNSAWIDTKFTPEP